MLYMTEIFKQLICCGTLGFIFNHEISFFICNNKVLHVLIGSQVKTQILIVFGSVLSMPSFYICILGNPWFRKHKLRPLYLSRKISAKTLFFKAIISLPQWCNSFCVHYLKPMLFSRSLIHLYMCDAQIMFWLESLWFFIEIVQYFFLVRYHIFVQSGSKSVWLLIKVVP